MHDDVNFLSIFLATYRTFVPPTQVVDMLLERYENLSYEEKQERDASDESYSAADCEAIKVLAYFELFYPLWIIIEINSTRTWNVDWKTPRGLAATAQVPVGPENTDFLYNLQGKSKLKLKDVTLKLRRRHAS